MFTKVKALIEAYITTVFLSSPFFEYSVPPPRFYQRQQCRQDSLQIKLILKSYQLVPEARSIESVYMGSYTLSIVPSATNHTFSPVSRILTCPVHFKILFNPHCLEMSYLGFSAVHDQNNYQKELVVQEYHVFVEGSSSGRVAIPVRCLVVHHKHERFIRIPCFFKHLRHLSVISSVTYPLSV